MKTSVVASVTELIVHNIQQLQQLDKYSNLLSLIANGCKISSFYQLFNHQSLKYLQRLNLSDNSLSSFDYFKSLPNLQYLNIKNNDFKTGSEHSLNAAFQQLNHLIFDNSLNYLWLFQKFFLERFFETKDISYNSLKAIECNFQLSGVDILIQNSNKRNIFFQLFKIKPTEIELVTEQKLEQFYKCSLQENNSNYCVVVMDDNKCCCCYINMYKKVLANFKIELDQYQIQLLGPKQTIEKQDKVVKLDEFGEMIQGRPVPFKIKSDMALIKYFQSILTHEQLIQQIIDEYQKNCIKISYDVAETKLQEALVQLKQNYQDPTKIILNITYNDKTTNILLLTRLLDDNILKTNDVHVICYYQQNGIPHIVPSLQSVKIINRIFKIKIIDQSDRILADIQQEQTKLETYSGIYQFYRNNQLIQSSQLNYLFKNQLDSQEGLFYVSYILPGFDITSNIIQINHNVKDIKIIELEDYQESEQKKKQEKEKFNDNIQFACCEVKAIFDEYHATILLSNCCSFKQPVVTAYVKYDKYRDKVGFYPIFTSECKIQKKKDDEYQIDVSFDSELCQGTIPYLYVYFEEDVFQLLQLQDGCFDYEVPAQDDQYVCQYLDFETKKLKNIQLTFEKGSLVIQNGKTIWRPKYFDPYLLDESLFDLDIIQKNHLSQYAALDYQNVQTTICNMNFDLEMYSTIFNVNFALYDLLLLNCDGELIFLYVGEQTNIFVALQHHAKQLFNRQKLYPIPKLSSVPSVLSFKQQSSTFFKISEKQNVKYQANIFKDDLIATSLFYGNPRNLAFKTVLFNEYFQTKIEKTPSEEAIQTDYEAVLVQFGVENAVKINVDKGLIRINGQKAKITTDLLFVSFKVEYDSIVIFQQHFQYKIKFQSRIEQNNFIQVIANIEDM
ncbi:Leucine_rich repeat 4 [Hexamita inflata]|uniref:Leucine rich repeat 4 n=1 Tax=Hexamita inflata TaxID=28002 RepID=A0AA86TQ89_9EUKA|nr:Leucine rich repeat 4 [Hexamita inflata]